MAKPVNRLYMPYGVGSNGIIQINDLAKVLPPPYGSGVYVNPARPTDAELLQGQIGVVYMPGAEGGHSAMPLYGIKLKQYANFTNNNVRDILAVSSEETDNRCTGSPHLMYLLDITGTIGQGGNTSAEQHPWPISTVTVDDFSGTPQLLFARYALRRSLARGELPGSDLCPTAHQRLVRRRHTGPRHP